MITIPQSLTSVMQPLWYRFSTAHVLAKQALCISASFAVTAAYASGPWTELPGAHDHPLISRYAGSVLYNAADERFASVRVPAQPRLPGGSSESSPDLSKVVEGHVSANFYVVPKDRTALEVFRNYQMALKGAGFTTLYACEMRACDNARVTEDVRIELLDARKWNRDRVSPGGSFNYDVRFTSAKLSRAGVDTYVMVFVGEPNSIWEAPMVAVVVAVPGAVDTGQVAVSTDRLQKGLADEGKIALYGIYFDTGRAEIKPESKSQLDEMAKLLNANKSLKVAIVGHTDNQGGVDANTALSQRRAEAVVAALVSTYKVDASRLRARGVASFAPVASNRTEAGRAKNRRVELVEQ
jgi:outer membrane protein OmpA-like peptidoglycan-associated protein